MEYQYQHQPTTRVVQKTKVVRNASGGIYGLAFIGALVYYIQHAATFGMGVIGFFKALFWPAVLIYKILEFLKA